MSVRAPSRSSSAPPIMLSYHCFHDDRYARGNETPISLTSMSSDPSAATLHFHVNESMLATRLVSRPWASNTKFEHSQAFCFPAASNWLPFDGSVVTCGHERFTAR